ncbi:MULTISPECIES: C40 family peptidase [Paenibacillus]|uniref:C40 family peptidase n=1 Tax=Paenibacillus radicis (ex Xue et al. 2023) TaxID=2972489 RepID=A0ABT1YSK5_9BACL|nr:C40 family peptidase [Paenibacillus radicis (ex Xue et al. 2023)]MCR8636173.1 C40 family peptidase [Paenibacillus radicis (ex Xue et al. 2023)]
MKKFFGIAMSLALFFTIQVGSASAETPMSQAVNDGLGSPYKSGGTTKKGFDCSGYTAFVFDKLGISLPHQSKSQAALGTTVSQDELRAGDLVFFDTENKVNKGVSGISHVGVYVGDGKFYHSATGKGISINKLSEAYYVKTYVTAKRILSDEQYADVMTDN